MFHEFDAIRDFLVVSLTGAALALSSGCSLPIEDWESVPAAKAPRVGVAEYAHDVRFEAGSARLPLSERLGLDRFVERVAPEAGAVVSVLTGPTDLARRRAETVAAYLAYRGLEVAPAPDDFGTGAPDGEAVRVVARRHVVTLPGCPDWSGRPGHTFGNLPTTNFGCATAVNLGLMVAEPADLARGRSGGVQDGAYGVLGEQRYRKGETTAIAPEDVGTIEAAQKSSSGGGEE